jgi:hypothetical protein
MSQNYIKWILDSGAIDHMTRNQNAFKKICIITNDQHFNVANN